MGKAIIAARAPSATVLAQVANANASAGKVGIGHNNPPKTEASATQIATAGALGWRSAGNDIAVSALWKEIAEVGEVKAVKHAFWRNYLARRAFPNAVKPSAAMLAEGERIRKMKGSDRSETEAQWFDAARQAFSRLSRKAKVRSDHGQGGNKNAAKKPSAAPKAVTVAQVVKAKTPPLPKVQNETDVGAFVDYEIKRLQRFINENAGKAGEYKSAVADFAKVVKAIMARASKPAVKKAA